VYGWIDPFYEPAEAAIEPGHIWCGQPLQLPPRQALKIDRVNPKDDSKVDFTLSARTPDTFEHPPVHSLGLGTDEGLVLARTTRNRPVVVLGGTTAAEIGTDGATDAGTAIVVPIFAAEQYDEATVTRVAAYGFTNAFYLPASAQPGFPEGFARLDQAQPVVRAHLTDHQGLKLSADALDALVEWFVAFSTNRQPEDSLILEYRRERLAGGGA
jgi:hypothetical protein